MADPTLVTNPDLAAQVANANIYLQQIASFIQHGTLGGAIAHGLEWAKGSPKFSWFWNALSKRSKAYVSAGLAFLGSMGVTAVFSHDPNAAGVYTIVLSGLTLPSLGQHAWSFVQSWLTQQGYYVSVLKPKAVTGVEPTGTGSGVAPTATAAPVAVVLEGVKR